MLSAEPLAYGPGEWQADSADLARMERELEISVPSESTATDSSSSIQQVMLSPYGTCSLC